MYIPMSLRELRQISKLVNNLSNSISMRTRNMSTTNMLLQTRPQQRFQIPQQKATKNTTNAVLYTVSGVVLMIGFTYAAVPLYKAFCEAQGLDTNSTFKDISDEDLKNKMNKLKRTDRQIKVKFTASTSAELNWTFVPSHGDIQLAIGETALAFYRAKNLTNRPIVGIATYNIIPFEAGLYFNKIQCFCFEEQRLEPGEEVDMPVFFYIDDEFHNDPLLENVDSICLSYMFFESKDSIDLQNQIPKVPKTFFQ